MSRSRQPCENAIVSATNFAEDHSAISAPRMVTLRSGDEAAALTSFCVSRRLEDLLVAVRMNIGLAPMTALTKGEDSCWEEGWREAAPCRRSHDCSVETNLSMYRLALVVFAYLCDPAQRTSSSTNRGGATRYKWVGNDFCGSHLLIRLNQTPDFRQTFCFDCFSIALIPLVR